MPVILSAAKNLCVRRARFFATLRMTQPLAVILSAAKNLCVRRARFFAALRMTQPLAVILSAAKNLWRTYNASLSTPIQRSIEKRANTHHDETKEHKNEPLPKIQL